MPTNPKPRPRGLTHRQHLTLGLAAFAVLAGVAVLADYRAWQEASPTDPVPGPLQDGRDERQADDTPETTLAADRPPQEAFGNATLIAGGSSPTVGPPGP